MSKMNEYPSVGDQQEFTQAEKATFLGSAMCIATGLKNNATVTANIPFSDIRPTKLSDLTDDITVDTYDSTSEVPISGKGVAAALGNFGGFQVVSLTSGANPVPDVASPSNKLIYLTKEASAKTDPYTEWIYTGDPTTALDVSKWEVIGETTVDLSNYYTKGQTDTAITTAVDSIAPVQNSVLYGGGSGGINKPMDLRYDNTLTKVSGANGYELKVSVPVPSPGTNAHRGEVLTVNNSDEAVWAAPASGLPDPTGVTDGYVLTVNNGAASWAAPGGGGSSPLIIPITGDLEFEDDIRISSYITIPDGESALATFIEYCKNHLDTMFKLNYGTDIILFRLWSIDIDSSETMSKVHFIGSNCGYASVIYDLTVQNSEGDDAGWIMVTIDNDHFYSNP